MNIQVRKVTGLMQAGFVFLLAGWKWGYYFPVNKALWTSSYVLITTGWALVILSLCYWLIEIRGWKRWSKPFEIFGTNAVGGFWYAAVFLAFRIRSTCCELDGSLGNLRLYMTDPSLRTCLTAERFPSLCPLLHLFLAGHLLDTLP